LCEKNDLGVNGNHGFAGCEQSQTVKAIYEALKFNPFCHGPSHSNWFLISKVKIHQSIHIFMKVVETSYEITLKLAKAATHAPHQRSMSWELSPGVCYIEMQE
jgi:hypothetical protein